MGIEYGKTRVYLKSGFYHTDFNNPVKGTNRECIGTVIGESVNSMGRLQVRWDNGRINSYNPAELEYTPAEEDTGHCKSIW